MDPPQGAAMPVHSLPMKSRKRLVRDVFGTSDTHAGLVYDVSDNDGGAQNGGTHG